MDSSSRNVLQPRRRYSQIPNNAIGMSSLNTERRTQGDELGYAPSVGTALNFGHDREMILITVGESTSPPTEFTIHKALLEYNSSVLRATLKNTPITWPQPQHLSYSDISSDIFGYLVQWLYTSSFCSCEEPESHHHKHSCYTLIELAHLHILAQRFKMKALASASIKALADKPVEESLGVHGTPTTESPLFQLLRLIYDDSANREDGTLKKAVLEKLRLALTSENTHEVMICLEALGRDVLFDFAFFMAEMDAVQRERAAVGRKQNEIRNERKRLRYKRAEMMAGLTP